MSRLVVVSNRVPFRDVPSGAGGLAVALQAALDKMGGLWFGWSGEIAENPALAAKVTDLNHYSLATLDLTAAEFEGYYEQHANRCLWPLLHGRLDLARFDHASYETYRAVNRRFAAALEPGLVERDLVWVHDYHLIPLGRLLREAGVRAPLGFFLHTPMPPPDTLMALPWAEELIGDLESYDVVGFQTKACVRNFQDAAERLSRAAHDLGAGRPGPVVLHNPIGIDTTAFAGLAAAKKVERRCARLRARLEGQSWAVGVERLDYTKGLAERFLAWEQLLDSRPGLQGKVGLLQIAAPSRKTVAEYQTIQRELEWLSGRINGRFGWVDWTPIQFINRAFDHIQLAALYRFCRVGVVTPLKDGMNLVAKEYVASQDADDPGVLLLSRFAGAAEELQEAVLVNPYDTEDLAEGLARAFEMPLAERQERWQAMMKTLRGNDVHRWRQRFLDALTSARDGARPLPDAEPARARPTYAGTDKRAGAMNAQLH